MDTSTAQRPRARSTVARLSGVAGLAAALVVVGALPAAADVPEGWEVAPSIDTLELIGVLVGVPVLLFLVIVVLVYGPALARGERVAPGAAAQREDQWIGGPRRTVGELAAPDGAESKAGGSSGQW